jgi:hypothetical protein
MMVRPPWSQSATMCSRTSDRQAEYVGATMALEDQAVNPNDSQRLLVHVAIGSGGRCSISLKTLVEWLSSDHFGRPSQSPPNQRGRREAPARGPPAARGTGL